IGANQASSNGWLGAVSAQNPQAPISGSGRFASLTLQAKDPGVSEVGVSPLLVDRNGVELPSMGIPGTITVLAYARISGVVTLQGRTNHAGITVSIAGANAQTNQTDAAGAFLFDRLPSGTFNVTASSTGYLSRIAIISVTNGEMSILSPRQLLGGDVNNDGVVSIADATFISANYGQFA